MTEPKLLPTEQEWRKIVLQTYDETMRAIRERGLIAPEPVDPLVGEAKDMAWGHVVWDTEDDLNAAVDLALAALKRGMELAERPTLTREQVRQAMREGITDGFFSSSDVTRLHAALTGGDAWPPPRSHPLTRTHTAQRG